MALGTILVCLDGSSFDAVGLSYALPIARARNAELLLVEVYEISEFQHPRPVDTVGVEIAHAESTQYLQGVATQLRTRGVDVRIETAEGRPADQILNIADREDVELIVLGSHGRREAGIFRLGSTAHQVVQHARQSLLLVRKPASAPPLRLEDVPMEQRIDRVLVLLDGSSSAEGALPAATSMAISAGSELILGHVVAEFHWPSDKPPCQSDRTLLSRVSQRREELATAYLHGVERRLRGQGIRCRVVTRTAASTRHGVLSLVADEQVDLVVLASHGQTSSDRVTHGSVTQQLLFYSQIPVFVVQCLLAPARRVASVVSLEEGRSDAIRPHY